MVRQHHGICEKAMGKKPWRYVLIPRDGISASMTAQWAGADVWSMKEI